MASLLQPTCSQILDPMLQRNKQLMQGIGNIGNDPSSGICLGYGPVIGNFR
jgi:hypothetical protein